MTKKGRRNFFPGKSKKNWKFLWKILNVFARINDPPISNQIDAAALDCIQDTTVRTYQMVRRVDFLTSFLDQLHETKPLWTIENSNKILVLKYEDLASLCFQVMCVAILRLFSHSFNNSFIHAFIHSFIHSIFRLIFHSLIHLVTQKCLNSAWTSKLGPYTACAM